MLNIKKTLIVLYSFAKAIDVAAELYSENKERIDKAVITLVDACRVLIGKQPLITTQE